MRSETKPPNYSKSITLPVFGQIPILPSEICRDLKVKEGSPLWAQFFKYGVCGVLSLVLTLGIVVFVEHQWPSYLDHQVLTKAMHQRNMTVVLVCAFVPINFFAYFTNRIFVFTPGRHSLYREAVIFTIVSALSFAGGEVGKRVMLELDFNNIIATLSFAFSSALVNFIARKFLIFKS